MSADFGSTTTHKGNKDHKCIWCGEVIPKGTMMAHFKGSWEGAFQDWRMHEECYKSVEDSKDSILEEGFTPYEGRRGLVNLK
jgi:hypothetical protein